MNFSNGVVNKVSSWMFLCHVCILCICHACLLVSSRSVCSLLMSSSPLRSLFFYPLNQHVSFWYSSALWEAWLYDLVCSQYPGCLGVAPDRHLVSPFLRCFIPIADGCGMQHSGLQFLCSNLLMHWRYAWLACLARCTACLQCRVDTQKLLVLRSLIMHVVLCCWRSC